MLTLTNIFCMGSTVPTDVYLQSMGIFPITIRDASILRHRRHCHHSHSPILSAPSCGMHIYINIILTIPFASNYYLQIDENNERRRQERQQRWLFKMEGKRDASRLRLGSFHCSFTMARMERNRIMSGSLRHHSGQQLAQNCNFRFNDSIAITTTRLPW